MIAVVQARAGSTRLPRKVLRDLGGRPVLAWTVAAAQDSAACDRVVVATTTDPADDAVAALATQLGATVARGPVDDVLTRFLRAVDAVGPAGPDDAIVRLTADCPLLDPALIAQCADTFRSAGFPSCWPRCSRSTPWNRSHRSSSWSRSIAGRVRARGSG